jgi:hypothetical protein
VQGLRALKHWEFFASRAGSRTFSVGSGLPFDFLRRSTSPIKQNGSPTEFFAMILPEHVRSAHSADGAILLDIREGKMFRINFVGSRVVELLRAGLPEPEIVERLAIEFACEPAIVAADVRRFLEQLRQHHLFDNQQNASPAVR